MTGPDAQLNLCLRHRHLKPGSAWLGVKPNVSLRTPSQLPLLAHFTITRQYPAQGHSADHTSVAASTSPIVRGDRSSRVLHAASQLSANGGIAALTTRAVAAAASVQPPTLYRLFGDKRGLLDALAEHGLTSFIAGKVAAAPHPDPVHDLRDAWDAYVAFGLANPAVFAIMNETGSSAPRSPAVLAGIAVLRARVRPLALAGRLRVPEDRAVTLIYAAGVGTVTTLLASSGEERDLQLSMVAREAVLAALVSGQTGRAESALAPLAVSLRAHLDATDVLTPGERLLLGELLDRLAGLEADDPAVGTSPAWLVQPREIERLRSGRKLMSAESTSIRDGMAEFMRLTWYQPARDRG